MNLKIILTLFIFPFFLSNCAEYKFPEQSKKKEKKFYSLIGFALVYDDSYYEKKIINKKINNDKNDVMHDNLKTNTKVRITNPENSKFIETRIVKNATYPKIFTAVISQKISTILNLDQENPYIEIAEIKKNKTFIAKKANTFEEEKNVVNKAPVDQIEIANLSNKVKKNVSTNKKNNNFAILINDFYYEKSAIGLKNELIKKTNVNKFYIKKINDNKYRLLVGPFKNFNALKTTYISLNNLGFKNLNIYKN